jgi:hypothetical protein
MQSGRAHEPQSRSFPEAAAAARSEGFRLPVRRAAYRNAMAVEEDGT